MIGREEWWEELLLSLGKVIQDEDLQKDEYIHDFLLFVTEVQIFLWEFHRSYLDKAKILYQQVSYTQVKNDDKVW